jgi:hypothetical protein
MSRPLALVARPGRLAHGTLVPAPMSAPDPTAGARTVVLIQQNVTINVVVPFLAFIGGAAPRMIEGQATEQRDPEPEPERRPHRRALAAYGQSTESVALPRTVTIA